MTLQPLNSHPTLASIEFDAVDFDPFAAGELATVVPATDSQKEIWLATQLGQGANCAYNESQTLRLLGRLNTKALQKAVQQLVLRHEALRANFSPGDVSLCVTTSRTIEVPVVDLSNADDRPAQIAQLRRQAVETPFDLVKDVLFRATIVHCDPQEHLLILTGHHIVCDGWSWGVLLPDLAALYSAGVGDVVDLGSPACFSEYALSQHEQAYSRDFAAAEQFWLKQFAGSVPVLDFPLDRPRPALKTYTARREDWTLNPDLVKSLKKVGAKARCSFFTTLLASFEVWLHRLTGQSDLVVGTPAAGQSFFGVEGLVGHCVNFLPLRTFIDPAQPFVDYLQLRSSEVLDAYEHQQLTFGSLVKKLAIPRDPSRVPLVSAVFNYDRGLTPKDMPFSGLEVELFSNPRSFENFDLFVNASDANGKLVLECQYNTDLFDAETIQRRMAEFEVLLAGVATDPTQAIAQLPIVPASEQTLLRTWNQTQTDYPAACIHQLFEAQAARTPNAIAVVFEKQKLTYQELDQRANQLANYLRSRGVGSEVMVGICLERSLEMVIGLLAILKAGGAYIPLDPAHPVDRIAYVLQDTAAPIILTQRSLIEKLPAAAAQLICLDDKAAIAKQSDKTPASPVTPQTLAYVIYTSGSTGRPKGVQISHQAVVNFLQSMQHTPGLSCQDVLLSVTTISFDIAALELFLPLVTGAKVVIASRAIAADGIQLAALLTQTQATVMQATPATWQMLITTGWQGSDQLKLLCGGEALSWTLATALLERCQTLWNLYGPTETTIWSAVGPVDAREGVMHIGKPIANTQFYVLDAYQNPVPIGVSGELYIGGDGLARGYFNRPDLTAERFIPSPFDPEARLYKTGDLARFLPDGTVECLGRLDYQVKVRGFRIELGEIESVLRQHPNVQETVVVAREDSPGNKRLVSYVIPRSQPAPAMADLRSHISRGLPDYMVPSAIVFLEGFPLTSSGKVDRKALPAPDLQLSSDSSTFAPAETALERQLVEIWQEVLAVQPIGVRDNFFELGGHSLLAVKATARIEQAIGKKFPLSALFYSPTIQQIAEILEQDNEIGLTKVNTTQSTNSPLFLFEPSPKELASLTQHLTFDRPVYVINCGLYEVTDPTTHIKQQATQSLQEIKAIQPEGPYLLAGFCMGGLVAFDVAQQLQAMGEKIALLGLIETYFRSPSYGLPLSNPTAKKRFPRKKILNLRRHLGNLKRLKFTHQLAYIEQHIQYMIQAVTELLPGGVSDQEKLRRSLVAAGERAAEYYTPERPYTGEVTFFFGEVNTDSKLLVESEQERFVRSGCDRLVSGNVAINLVPGDHWSLLKEPHVTVLAELLQTYTAREVAATTASDSPVHSLSPLVLQKDVLSSSSVAASF